MQKYCLIGKVVSVNILHQGSPYERYQKPAILDNKASITMFKRPYRVLEGSYRHGDSNSEKLAPCCIASKCLGSDTIFTLNINLEGSPHVNEVYAALLFVGQICGQDIVMVL